MNIQDYLQPKRYYSSFGCDLSVKGTAMAGWNSTAITLPTITATNEANLDWETWSDASTPGTWTEDQALTRTASPHTGTYCGGIAGFPTAAWTLVAHQHVLWNAEYQNRVFHVRGWGKCSHNWSAGDAGVKFAIYDGVGRTYSGNCGNSGTDWTQSTVGTRQLDASATELTIEVYLRSDGNAYNYSFDDMEFIDPTVGAVKRGVTFNTHEYIPYGNNLIKINGSTSAVSYIYSLPAAITSLCPYQVSGTDYLFIFLGTSEAYWYMVVAETFTQSTATNKTYQFSTWVNTTVDTMYANDGANTIRSTINPLNGGTAWSSQTIVGSAANAITHLQEKDGALLIDKVDRPYYLSATGTVQKDLAPECDSGKSTHSGKNSTSWNGEYYRPTGDQALLRAGTSNEWIQPSKYATQSGDFTGQVEACAGDEEYLYVGTDNSTKIEIHKTREEIIDGTLTRVWHPIHELTLAGIEAMWISTVYQKRLYIASTASSVLYYLPLPTKYGDITNDSNKTFKTTTYWETPYLHGRFLADTKGWLKTVATLGHAYDADIYWTIQYKKLQDSSYTNIGNLVGTATDRTHTLYIPVDGSSNNPISTMMRFKLIAVTDDTAKTPILNSLDIRAILYPSKKDIIWAKVKIAKEMTTMDGKSTDKYAKMKACLDKCRDATYPVTMKDIDGVTRYVRFLQLPNSLPWREIVSDEKGRDYDYIYNLLMLQTPTS
jgi:hypothetical protein